MWTHWSVCTQRAGDFSLDTYYMRKICNRPTKLRRTKIYRFPIVQQRTPMNHVIACARKVQSLAVRLARRFAHGPDRWFVSSCLGRYVHSSNHPDFRVLDSIGSGTHKTVQPSEVRVLDSGYLDFRVLDSIGSGKHKTVPLVHAVGCRPSQPRLMMGTQ